MCVRRQIVFCIFLCLGISQIDRWIFYIVMQNKNTANYEIATHLPYPVHSAHWTHVRAVGEMKRLMLAKQGNYNLSNPMWFLSQLAKLYVAMAAACFVCDLQPLLLSQSRIATLCHLPTKLAQVYLLQPLNGNTLNSYLFTLLCKHSKDLRFTFTCKPGKSHCYSCIFVPAWCLTLLPVYC